MQFPTVPIVIDCVPAFRKRAEHAFRMLGLIAGFAPAFLDDGPAGALWYSYDKPEGASLWFAASMDAHEFLAQKNIYDAERALAVTVQGHSVLRLFPTEGAEAGDIIAATFFFLSLHEEWSTDERDQFGRFLPGASLLGKLDLLDRPVVASYAAVLLDAVRSAGFQPYTGPRFNGKRTAIAVTHDIDYITKATPGLMYREAVTHFLHNGTRQPFGSRARRLREYVGFCLNGDTDPYRRSLQRMKEEEERRDIRGTWYFKAGGHDKRDTGYTPSHPFVRNSIRDLREAGHEIGFHPSFRAHTDASMFATERESLMHYSGPIHACRQHYLRFSYPDTLRIQEKYGIYADSTLGFASHEGFRNGACHPFIPYDLDRDTPLGLWEVPLVMMDGTLDAYRNMSAESSLERILELMGIVAAHNGAVSFLFHNVTYDSHDYPGWDIVFEKTLDAFKERGVHSGSIKNMMLSWLPEDGMIQKI